MPALLYHTKLMLDVVRASREIIKLKRILRRLKWFKSDLKQVGFDAKGIQDTVNNLKLRIVQLQGYISRQMEVITEPLFFFKYEMTHFTQKELDKGYAIIEYPMSDEPMHFDVDGDFVQVFATYVLFLHNGKVIPLTDLNIPIIYREARPV